MIWKKIALKLKWMTQDVVGSLVGLPVIEGKDGEVRVLCFHGVCADDNAYINGRFIKQSHLRELLRYLKLNTQVLSLADFAKGRLNPARLNVLLTFDDGYRNLQSHLLPVLEELQLPATVFATATSDFLWPDLFDIAVASECSVISIREKLEVPRANHKELKQTIIASSPRLVAEITDELIELTKDVRDRYALFHELLSDEELMALGKHSLISLGNHTANHYHPNTLSDNEIKNEIECCEARISLGEIRSVALPFGGGSMEHVELLKRLNYFPIFVMDSNHGHPDAVVRLTVNPFISLRNQIRAIAHGKY